MRSQRSNLVRTGRWQQYEMLVIGVASGSFCIYRVITPQFFSSIVPAIEGFDAQDSLESASNQDKFSGRRYLKACFTRFRVKTNLPLKALLQAGFSRVVFLVI